MFMFSKCLLSVRARWLPVYMYLKIDVALTHVVPAVERPHLDLHVLFGGFGGMERLDLELELVGRVAVLVAAGAEHVLQDLVHRRALGDGVVPVVEHGCGRHSRHSRHSSQLAGGGGADEGGSGHFGGWHWSEAQMQAGCFGFLLLCRICSRLWKFARVCGNNKIR